MEKRKVIFVDVGQQNRRIRIGKIIIKYRGLITKIIDYYNFLIIPILIRWNNKQFKHYYKN